MPLYQGDLAPAITLNDIRGQLFDSTSLAGKPYLLSFYRFSSCPFCNLRIHELIQRMNELGSDFKIMAIFDATLPDLKRHTERHEAPFPILADEKRQYYELFDIEFSLKGMLTGMVFRFPTLLKGLLRGYLPFNMFKRGLITMPADFLVDGNGVIQNAYYGKDEGDHLSFEKIVMFSKEKQE